MTVAEIQREQEKLAPKEDLTPYAGQWVALRDGRVIAHDIDPAALRDREDVTEDDAIIPVAADAEDGLLLL